MMRYLKRGSTHVFGLLGCLLFAARIDGADAAGPKGKASDELFRDGFIPKIRIQIPPEGMAKLRKYEWKWGGNDDQRVAVPGTVIEGGRTYTNVSIRLKGAAGSFRPVDQNPGLTLNFDKWADGQRFHGLQKLSLNNSIQDASLCSDKFTRELYRKVGVPVPRAGHARVFLNDRDLGLYVLTEGWNKQFLHQSFKNAEGNLYDCGFAKEINPNMQVNSGADPTDHSDITALIAAANEATRKKSLEPLNSVLDVDRFLRLLVLDGLLWNWDGYSIGHNNYRVFYDRESGKMIFMPHGLDQMFWRPNGPIMPGGKGLVAKAVLASPEGRDRYLALTREFMNSWFNSDDLVDRVVAISESLEPVLREIGPAAQTRQRRGLTMLCTLMRQRIGSLRLQLAGSSRLLRLDSAQSVVVTNWNGTPDANGSLHLKANDKLTTVDSTLWLEAGYYRVEGRVKTTGVKGSSNEGPAGAGFRATSDRKPSMGTSWDWFPFRESNDPRRAELTTPKGHDERIPGDSDWRRISYDFELHQPMADLKLACELRADKGEAWFDLGSLKLTRLSGPPKKAPARAEASR
jgi:hypothetical protein